MWRYEGARKKKKWCYSNNADCYHEKKIEDTVIKFNTIIKKGESGVTAMKETVIQSKWEKKNKNRKGDETEGNHCHKNNKNDDTAIKETTSM